MADNSSRSFAAPRPIPFDTVSHDAEQIYIRNKANRHGRQGDKLAPATPRWLLLDRERGAAVPSPQESTRMIDAIWELRGPDGLSSDIIVEVKADPVEPKLVGSVASQLKALSHSKYEQAGATPANMLVSTYLSPLTRERLAEAGIGYADSTGNIRFTVDRPAVYIETQGADKNPFREERPLRSLKGGRAARVARGLLDYRTPFGTRELAGETASSTAMISRVSSPVGAHRELAAGPTVAHPPHRFTQEVGSAASGVGTALAQPGHQHVAGSGGDGQQWVIAPRAGVVVVSRPFFVQSIGLADGGVQVDGQGRVAGSGPSGPCACQQLAAHPVELTDMPPPEAAQEGAQGGWRLDHAAENTDRPTSTQRIGVVDEVAARQRGSDQRQQFVPRVRPPRGAAEVEVMADEFPHLGRRTAGLSRVGRCTGTDGDGE